MSRRFTTITRALCTVAILLGALGFLTPQRSLAAASGGAFSWGADNYGTLCLGSVTTRQVTPQPATGAGSGDVTAVATGSYFTLLLKANGTVYACGNNTDYGMLGIGTTDSGNHPTPQQVVGLSNVISIAASDRHSLAAADGKVDLRQVW